MIHLLTVKFAFFNDYQELQCSTLFCLSKLINFETRSTLFFKVKKDKKNKTKKKPS